MGIPLKELQDRIDAPTFALYMAYDRLDPFGEERGDVRMALNTAYMVNAFSGSKMKVADCMLDFQPKTDKQKADKMLAKMSQFAAGHNQGKGK